VYLINQRKSICLLRNSRSNQLVGSAEVVEAKIGGCEKYVVLVGTSQIDLTIE